MGSSLVFLGDPQDTKEERKQKTNKQKDGSTFREIFLELDGDNNICATFPAALPTKGELHKYFNP